MPRKRTTRKRSIVATRGGSAIEVRQDSSNLSPGYRYRHSAWPETPTLDQEVDALVARLSGLDQLEEPVKADLRSDLVYAVEQARLGISPKRPHLSGHALDQKLLASAIMAAMDRASLPVKRWGNDGSGNARESLAF